MNSQVGTIYYVAPEVLFADYTDKADIWSIGVVAYVLVSILQFRESFCFPLFRFIVLTTSHFLDFDFTVVWISSLQRWFREFNVQCCQGRQRQVSITGMGQDFTGSYQIYQAFVGQGSRSSSLRGRSSARSLDHQRIRQSLSKIVARYLSVQVLFRGRILCIRQD